MSLKDELKTTPRYVQILAQNGITTMKDFFNYFPRTYEDRSKIAPLDSLIFDAKMTFPFAGLATINLLIIFSFYK